MKKLNEIELWCRRHGVKNIKLARMIGVGRSYACLLRQGKRNPSLKLAKKIHQRTGIPISELGRH